ncbi:MAG: hypothetical protein GWM92_13605 [Gemmatimonadetes bacterium]|nr:glycosyltransferase family 39 protein [Gemmatimonadota bacterium]NIR79759.1 glycosyltransferase family 39 protein [Gemmatimonadota bacterium]NIT88455.1 glycosyltransferase family 39 protein [Gemmatimonadota bacterium]NIU32278.1 glycosyltransferase family 39 protein [Gemmatimonadota bacterium]NIU36819.1 hypothetical protein [Gemmatimonadota bacterium]
MTGREEGAGSRDGAPRLGRADLWVGAGIVALQLGLMFLAFVPAPHSGGDNAGYLGLAHSLLERGAYLDLYLPGEPIHTKYPPLFAGLLAAAYLLGARTWVAFKAVPALATTAAVVLTYLWVRERRGPALAASVAFLVAASSAVVYYSHWILSDPPFLALTLFALWALARAERPEAAAEEGGEARDGDGVLRVPWLLLGCFAAILAYFTRSAGLPLVVAVALWLGLRRRWLPLAGFGAAFGVPALLWWLRGRNAPGEGSYLTELWLQDPYRPELGRAGPVDFVGRVGRNAVGYVGEHIPTGITGLPGPPATVLGVAVVGLAAWGWYRRFREDRGPAELFAPLYLGLLLLWPVVWSGDRFALPLIPLLLFYGVDGLGAAFRRLHPRAPLAVGATGLLLLGLPALASWGEDARAASACRSRADQGPWACTGQRMAEFAAAARWSGEQLPQGAVVVSRKPRIFYVLSGVKSEIYPLSREPDEFFARAGELGARYLVLDVLDNLSRYYAAAVIQARPGAFCPLAAFGEEGGPRTRVLGILPGGEGAGASPGDAARLSPCPEGLRRGEPRSLPAYSSFRVPLLGGSAP